MKKFLLSLMLLVMFAPFALHADEITIGNGASNTNTAPFGNAYAYTWTEMLYQSSEIGQACNITSLSFNCATVGFFGTLTASEMDIYLAEVTKSELSQANFTPESDLTLVYSGTNVVVGDEEWETLTLDTPFPYSGENNLVIVISKSASVSNMNIRWSSDQIANSIMFDFHDTNPAGALFPNENSYCGGNGYLFNQRPVVKLGTGEGGQGGNEDNDDEEETAQQYRIKSNSTNNYLNIFNNTKHESGAYGGVGVAEYAESNAQIFTLEDAGNNQYYLLSADGYYVKCWAWNVDAYSTTDKTAIEMVDNGNDTFRIKNCANNNYFKVEYVADGGEYFIFGDCNGSNGTIENWTLEAIENNEGEEGEGNEGEEGEEGEIAFSCDFNDGTLGDMIAIDKDGDGLSWLINEAQGIDQSDCISSWTYGFYNPENYLITNSAYTIEEGDKLEWYIQTTDAYYFQELYGVVVSADGENFVTVMEETIAESAAEYELRTADLSEYAGQTLHIGFVYKNGGSWSNGLRIDNIKYAKSSNTEDPEQPEQPEDPEQPEEPEVATLFSFDFNDSTTTGWRDIDQDGDAHSWFISEYAGVGGTPCIMSETYSFNGGNLYPDNYFVTTEAYEIATGSTLTWKVRPTDASFCNEHYAIVVSTDNATFTNVWEETLTSMYDFADRTLDLNDYAGQSVYVGFRHYNCNGSNATALIIDDVVLTSGNDNGEDPEQPELATTFSFDFNSNLEGWTVIDVNNDTYTWEISDGIMQVGSDGTKCLFSLSTSLQPNDYVVTESAYSITATSTLSFEVKTDNKFYPDHYSVEISEDGENFTLVMEENAPEAYTTKTIDLSAYAGKNLYIAFHHFNSNYCAGVLIDNAVLTSEGGNIEPELGGDTWEDAIVVSSFPYTSTPDYAQLNNDYTLPGEAQDGADVVYKLTFTEETTFNAAIEGANGKLALYAEDFNGEDGPGADNYYVVEETPEPAGETSFSYDFNDGNLDDFITIDADGDGHNWYIGDWGINDATLTSNSFDDWDGALTPDNYISTADAYSITAASTLSFRRDSNYEEHFSVVISTDNVNFTSIYEETCKNPAEKLLTLSLSEYAGQNLHIGFRHFNCTDGYTFFIDDLALTCDSTPEEPGEVTSIFSDNFNDNNTDGWRKFQFDTDGYNWDTANSYGMAGPDNSTCLYSLSYATGILYPDNFIVTTSKFSITSASTLSFDVTPMNYSYIFDKYGVVISEDNENWTVIYSEAFDETSEQGWVNRSVDLGAYAGKEIYIGLRHYDCDGNWGTGVLVDNIALTDGSAKRNGGNTLAMTVPAGTYYLVASATEAFTVSIDVEGEEEPQIAKVTFEVEVINANSAKTTARPNEFTAEYHYSVYETAEVNAAGGVEAIALELREDETPYTEIDIWTWEWFEPETEYYIIGTAMNAAGEWGPTTYVTFTTPEAEIEYEAAEVTVEIETINATSVVVSTTSNEYTTEYHIGSISKAMFDYMGEDVIVSALQNDGLPYTGNNEHTLSNLNPSTEYYVIVTAMNEAGEWAPATVEAFTTLESDPEPQIAEITIEVEVLGAREAKSTVTPNEFAVGYIYSIFDKAEVEASSVDAIAAELQAEGIAYTDVDIWTWENLEPETEYYFIGTAQNAAGEWGPTASVSFITDEDGLIELNSMVTVYPNPATSVIYIKYENNAQVSLIDMTGRCVKATEISGDATINVEDLEKGMYIIKIQEGDNTMIQRVVVK